MASSKMAAATADAWSRPWTARSTQLPTAKSSHTIQTMTAVGERNTCGLPGDWLAAMVPYSPRWSRLAPSMSVGIHLA